MKYKIILILACLAINSCDQQKPQTNTYTDSLAATITEKENSAHSGDTLGQPIAQIYFQVKPVEHNVEDTDISPYIHLENPEEDIRELINADEVVLPYATSTLIIDYPMTNAAKFDLTTVGKGLTRKQLILEICKRYKEIYRDEETSATTKTTPVKERKGLINRNETNGKYGIWGHDLNDLVLSEVDVYRNNQGQIILMLGIDS